MVLLLLLFTPTEPYNSLRLTYNSRLDGSHRHQQQQLQLQPHHLQQPGSPVGAHSKPPAATSSASSMTAGRPWLGFAGLHNLMQPGGVHEEVRMRMTRVTLQLAELACQLVSLLWLMPGTGQLSVCLHVCMGCGYASALGPVQRCGVVAV